MKHEYSIEQEYLRLSLRAIVETHNGSSQTVTTFTNRLSDGIPVLYRKRMGFPGAPKERLQWIINNADYIVGDGDGMAEISLFKREYLLYWKKQHITAYWGDDVPEQWQFNPEDPFGDPFRDIEYEEMELRVMHGADDQPIHDLQAQLEAEETWQRQAEEQASDAYSADNEWHPHPMASEYNGELLGPAECVVNMRVYRDGWITHSTDSRLSPMIEHETFVNIQIYIKSELGMLNRGARVRRQNGRGGYWVVHPDIFAKYGLEHIQNVVREAYALYGYAVYFTTRWSPATFQDVDLVE